MLQGNQDRQVKHRRVGRDADFGIQVADRSHFLPPSPKESISALAPGEATLLYCGCHAKLTKQESAFILARNDGRSLLFVSPKHNGFCFSTALAHAAWSTRRDSNPCSQIRSLVLTVCCRILRHSITHPAIEVRGRLSLENALGDLVVQDRPNWQRRKGPRAEVLASCSRGAEEPAFLPRDRRYFRKDRDV